MASPISFRDLKVWQQAMQLAIDIFQLSNNLPSTAAGSHVIASIQTASSEIPTRIAAGHKSGSRSVMLDECSRAREAAGRLESLLIITGQLYPNVPSNDLIDVISEVDTSLRTVIKRLSSPRSNRPVV